MSKALRPAIGFVIRDGQMDFVAVDEISPYLRRLRGSTTTRRLSHIEPACWPLRMAFRLLRRLFGDRGRVADWTRRWPCRWRVDFSPIGGPVHDRDDRGRPFADRQSAVRYEYDQVLAWMARAKG